MMVEMAEARTMRGRRPVVVDWRHRSSGERMTGEEAAREEATAVCVVREGGPGEAVTGEEADEDVEWAASFAARTFSATISPDGWERARAALERDIEALGAGLRIALSLQLEDDRSMEGRARRDRASLERASGHLERAVTLMETLEALLDVGCERVTVTRARVAPESL